MTAQPHQFTWPPAPITALLALIFGVELVLVLTGAGLWPGPLLRFWCFAFGAFDPGYLIGQTPLWQGQSAAMFVTHIFVHIGPLHMLGNLATLYLLWYLMPWLSTTDFLLIFAGSALSGALTYAMLSPAGPSMTGASGAVSGLAAVWILYEIFLMRIGRVLLLRRKRIVILIALVVVTLAVSVEFSISTAWQTHLGGALAGCAFASGLILRSLWEGRKDPIDRRNMH